MGIRPFILGTVVTLLAGGAGADDLYEQPIQNELDRVNQHYAIASKDFGNGHVQMHSRSAGADGDRHTIYSFDCHEKRHTVLFAGPRPPDKFTFEEPGNPELYFEEQDGVAPLAQHACTTHGYPLLEW